MCRSVLFFFKSLSWNNWRAEWIVEQKTTKYNSQNSCYDKKLLCRSIMEVLKVERERWNKYKDNTLLVSYVTHNCGMR